MAAVSGNTDKTQQTFRINFTFNCKIKFQNWVNVCLLDGYKIL